ncbi:MAG TPA: hypothetical protein V6C72_00280 [Chroococcales cyanobacterium]
MAGQETDPDSPPTLILEIKTSSGEVWGEIIASAREFKTGSLGYYANGKVTNPKTGKRYQLGSNIILIGSKK